MGERCLGLFAKFPEPGLVKSRLAVATTADWAGLVADAMIRDSVMRLADVNASRVLAYTPFDQASYFAEIAGDRFSISPQAEGDLGARLEAFVNQAFQAGARQAVVVGADSPTLPVAHIETAFRELDRADVVLGPAVDGGYYLLGCTEILSSVFRNIPWGTEHVLKTTVEQLAKVPCRLALLPSWYDVDTLEDWHMLLGHVAAMRLAGIDPKLPFLERLMQSDPPNPLRIS